MKRSGVQFLYRYLKQQCFIKEYKFILVNKYLPIIIDKKLKFHNASLIYNFKKHYNGNLGAILP